MDVCFFISTVPVPVVSLNIYDIGSTTMHVQWQPVGGATGYTVTYEPINATVPTKPKEVGALCLFILALLEPSLLSGPR